MPANERFVAHFDDIVVVAVCHSQSRPERTLYGSRVIKREERVLTLGMLRGLYTRLRVSRTYPSGPTTAMSRCPLTANHILCMSWPACLETYQLGRRQVPPVRSAVSCRVIPRSEEGS